MESYVAMARIDEQSPTRPSFDAPRTVWTKSERDDR